MKFIHTLAIALFCTAATIIAQDIQIVKIKNPDRSVDVKAINHSDIDYNIALEITMEGMELDTAIAPLIMIAAGSEIGIGRLLPTAPQTRYRINCRATPIDGSDLVSVQVAVPDITIYTKNGQRKSTQLRLYLERHDIPFQEFNATYSSDAEAIYHKMLDRRKVPRSEAVLPVVIIRGEIYHDIEDMDQFIADKLADR